MYTHVFTWKHRSIPVFFNVTSSGLICPQSQQLGAQLSWSNFLTLMWVMTEQNSSSVLLLLLWALTDGQSAAGNASFCQTWMACCFREAQVPLPHPFAEEGNARGHKGLLTLFLILFSSPFSSGRINEHGGAVSKAMFTSEAPLLDKIAKCFSIRKQNKQEIKKKDFVWIMWR